MIRPIQACLCMGVTESDFIVMSRTMKLEQIIESTKAGTKCALCRDRLAYLHNLANRIKKEN